MSGIGLFTKIISRHHYYEAQLLRKYLLLLGAIQVSPRRGAEADTYKNTFAKDMPEKKQ